MKRGDPVHTYALELLHRREVSGDQLAIFVALFDARRAADPDARRRRRDAAHGQAAAILAGQYGTRDATDAGRRQRLQPVLVAVLGDDATCDMFPDPAPWEVMRAAEMDLARELFAALAVDDPAASEQSELDHVEATALACGRVLAALGAHDGPTADVGQRHMQPLGLLDTHRRPCGTSGARLLLKPQALRRLLQLARDFGGTRL